MTLSDRSRRQVDPIGDVADGVDIGRGGTRSRIDPNAAVGADLDAGLLEAEAFDVGCAARREHHRIGVDGGAIVEMCSEPGTCPLHPHDSAPSTYANATAGVFLGQADPQVLIEPAQD